MRQLFSAFACKAIGSFFALSVLVLSSAHAAGLGKLTVLSALGHPLKAEIELTAVANDEADSIVVKLASHDAYRQANLEFNPVLYSLHFDVEKRGAKHVVKVSSGQAVNEPFLGMLLELKSNSGRITREYTFLLDPAELRTSSTAVVATPPERIMPVEAAQAEKPAPAAESKPAEQPAEPHQAIAPASAEKTAAAPSDKAAEPAKAGVPVAQEEKAAEKAPVVVEKKSEPVAEAPKQIAKYKVKKGDNLTEIAQKYKYEDVSLEQMLVSLYRANPNAFVAKNMNRLRAGRVLTVPGREDAIKTDHNESRKVIVAHAADFNQYRQKLAEHAAKMAAQREAASHAAGGAITAQVKDSGAAAKTTTDKLKLSKATAGTSAGLGLEDAAVAKALADERARVAELEKNISDLQRLLELKNKQLAAQEKSAADAESAKRAADAAAARIAANKAAAERLAALKAAAEKAAAEKAAADKLAEDKAAAEKAAAAAKLAADKLAAERAKLAAAQKEAVPATGAKPPVASASQVKKTPVKKPIKRVMPQPRRDKGFFGNLMDFIQDNTMIVAGGVGVLLLLLLLIRQRSKKKSLAPLGGSLVGETRDYQNSLFGSSGGQSVDTNNSIFNSGFTPSASLLDANEVDPIAEADVYIAYGREAQAIEILKEALRSHPERNALRVKLLEIYASQKDIQAFDLLAGELYGLTRGEGEEWIYAAGLGMAIDPTNPLYAGGDMSEELLNRPTSLQGSMTQPRQDSEEVEKKEERPAHLGYDFVQPSREQMEHPDLPLDLAGAADTAEQADVAAATADEFTAPSMEETPSAALPDLSFDLPGSEDSQDSAEKPAEPASLDFSLDDFDSKKDEPSTSGMSVSESSTLDFDHDASFSVASSDVAPEDQDFAAQIAAADEALAAIDKVEPYSPTAEETVETSEPASPPAAPLDFDFGSISLDLDQKGAPEASEQPAVQDEPQADTTPVNSAEMDTKLELAEAYIGIGDKEGARELLDEVMQDGSPDQIEKAKAALAKFS